MELLDYIREAPLYRSVFSAAHPTRSYAVVCFENEVKEAGRWFRKNIGDTPHLVKLAPKGSVKSDRRATLPIRERPELAVVVFGSSGRQKAVRLAAQGISEFAFDRDQKFSNHKFDRDVFNKYRRRFERIFAHLADEESRLVFASVLKHRITGDHGYLRISRYAQYQHPQVKACPGEWVGDCGALTGTTALRFAKAVGPQGSVFAFEPDPLNFEQLTERTQTTSAHIARIESLNYGLSDTVGEMRFESGNAGASKFLAKGDIFVPTNTLDQFAQDRQLSGRGMLSFDIEGFEYPALQGATNLIKDLRPKLQISLYHKKSDLFQLPLWVIDTFEDCKLYIGHHSPHHSETDLYVLPARADELKPKPLGWRKAENGTPSIWKSSKRKPGEFNSILAERRFGCGLSPTVEPPQSVDHILTDLGKPDPIEASFKIERFPQFLKRLNVRRQLGHARLKATDQTEEVDARIKLRDEAVSARRDQIHWMRNHFIRRAWTRKGFRERLCFFWGDHFTALGKTGVGSRGMSTYLESAIRPNIAGRFGDMLIAAVTNPLMLQYLDQFHSVGPNSRAALLDSDGARGLNENLAREVLELHTLGVAGKYSQADVTELARLFTGLTYSFSEGFLYKPEYSEPGAKTVLGVTYGGSHEGCLEDVKAVLNVLALHPQTAHHLATKIAVHFLGDTPDAGLIDQMATRYLETGGYLTEVYRVLLSHPAAWQEQCLKVKNPFDYVSSALRAIAINTDITSAMSVGEIQKTLMHPMALMGQPWEEPLGPDGWSESGAAWVTPQGLSARLQWAMATPVLYQPNLPDKTDIAVFSLGPEVPDRLKKSTAQANSAWEAVGLALGAPEFHLM